MARNHAKGIWWDESWSITTGCTPISRGCAKCWARRFIIRRRQLLHKGRPYHEIVCHDEWLEKPFHWRKPRIVALTFLGDIFHRHVPNAFIAGVFDVLADKRCAHHQFCVLTKRPARMAAVINWMAEHWPGDRPASVALEAHGHLGENVWGGVSVEDQATHDLRVPALMRAPWAKRFVHAEPMLGHLKLVGYPDWVIAGPENGPGARHAATNWFVALRAQCANENIPFYYKGKGAAVGKYGWRQYPKELEEVRLA